MCVLNKILGRGYSYSAFREYIFYLRTRFEICVQAYPNIHNFIIHQNIYNSIILYFIYEVLQLRFRTIVGLLYVHWSLLYIIWCWELHATCEVLPSSCFHRAVQLIYLFEQSLLRLVLSDFTIPATLHSVVISYYFGN